MSLENDLSYPLRYIQSHMRVASLQQIMINLYHKNAVIARSYTSFSEVVDDGTLLIL